MLERLFTVMAVILGFTGRRAELALKLGIHGIAIGAGYFFSIFEAFQNIVIRSFTWGRDAVILQLRFGFLGHPVGRPGFGEVLFNLKLFDAFVRQLKTDFIFDGGHGRATGIGGSNFNKNFVVFNLNRTCNAHLDNV